MEPCGNGATARDGAVEGPVSSCQKDWGRATAMWERPMPRTYVKRCPDRKDHVSPKPQEVPAKFRTGFLAELDGRTDLAKALRANYDAIVADVGGKDDVGHVKAALV